MWGNRYTVGWNLHCVSENIKSPTFRKSVRRVILIIPYLWVGREKFLFLLCFLTGGFLTNTKETLLSWNGGFNDWNTPPVLKFHRSSDSSRLFLWNSLPLKISSFYAFPLMWYFTLAALFWEVLYSNMSLWNGVGRKGQCRDWEDYLYCVFWLLNITENGN